MPARWCGPAARAAGPVSIAGVACCRPGDRPHLFYHLRVHRRRKGEAKGFTWQDYRDLIIAAHRGLSAPLVWIWDNLNIHLAPELADFAEENRAWLQVYRLPVYTPGIIPVEGIWSVRTVMRLRGGMELADRITGRVDERGRAAAQAVRRRRARAGTAGDSRAGHHPADGR